MVKHALPKLGVFLVACAVPVGVCLFNPSRIPFSIACLLSNLVAMAYYRRALSFYRAEFKRHSQDMQAQGREEKDLLRQAHTTIAALREKSRRYEQLRTIVEELSAQLNIETIAQRLVGLVFSSVSRSEGICILALVEPKARRLHVIETKKDRDCVIQEKEGDIYDMWVLKHSSCLFVNDTRHDFRFDSKKISQLRTRQIASLVIVPFITEQGITGILRTEHPQAGFYTQEDVRFLMALGDIAAVAFENAQLFKQTQQLAIHDELTGLYKKGYFLDRLKEEWRRSMRQHRAMAVCMIDIDHFKRYNDTHGHPAGDMVLREFSAILTDFFKDRHVTLGRFGGEEFCVLIAGAGKEEACRLSEELRTRVQAGRFLWQEHPVGITVSIGVAAYPDGARDDNELLLKADKALYCAKDRGRNRVIGM